MGKNVYITNLSSFLPNEPVENDAMEDVLGVSFQNCRID